MSNAMDMRVPKDLMQDFAKNYMQKLFYFCLKKTGNQADAEDLTQDIALQICTALHKEQMPESFSAWVWQIARNRYAVWAKRKRQYAESVTGADIGDLEIPDDSQNMLDEMIHNDDLSLLRRELAFISSDYRHVVVAYYFQHISIKDIASNLSLSVDAVKKRLWRARNILKEGMHMAREFGKRSYNPEEVTFTNSCSAFGSSGQPWNVLSHAMYKNIFLEAYDNPSTAEELSLELGVALPYMEDELAYLTRETFILEENGKYQTAFPIISKQAQEKIWKYNQGFCAGLTKLFEELIDAYTSICANHNLAYFGEHQYYNDAKWTLLMRAFDQLFVDADPEGQTPNVYTQRPDGGAWDIVGYQSADFPTPNRIGMHCAHEAGFYHYRFPYQGIQEKTPYFMTSNQAMTLKQVVEGKFAECDAKLLEDLEGYGYIVKCDNGYQPTIVLFRNADIKGIWQSFTEEEKQSLTNLAEQIKAILRDTREYACKVMMAELPSIFKDNKTIYRMACYSASIGRHDVFDQAMADGWLIYDENTCRTVGAFMNI